MTEVGTKIFEEKFQHVLGKPFFDFKAILVFVSSFTSVLKWRSYLVGLRNMLQDG